MDNKKTILRDRFDRIGPKQQQNPRRSKCNEPTNDSCCIWLQIARIICADRRGCLPSMGITRTNNQNNGNETKTLLTMTIAMSATTITTITITATTAATTVLQWIDTRKSTRSTDPKILLYSRWHSLAPSRKMNSTDWNRRSLSQSVYVCDTRPRRPLKFKCAPCA